MTSNTIPESERKRLVHNESQKKYYIANKEKLSEYTRSREGLVIKIYRSQRGNSKLRDRLMPDYSRKELEAWVFNQSCFETLYQSWVASGFKKDQVPSCDRLDDYKPYTLDNLRLVTWAENNARHNADRKAGINNKASKTVLQFSKEGVLIAEHPSTMYAGRSTGINQGNISSCCNGRYKSAGGYVWRFSY